jgi:hypothetical protein
MRIRLFGSYTAVRDYFPLLRWMIFTGVTVFGFALARYYGLFQLMMAQDRSGLCGAWARPWRSRAAVARELRRVLRATVWILRQP